MTHVVAEAYLHRLDPFLVQFPPGWPLDGIRWYGVAYLAGFLVAWLMLRWLARTHRTMLPTAVVWDMVIAVLIGVLVGGRLGYCVFYDQSLLTRFTSSFPYWGLLAINDGGMASHGGMIGIIVALWIFAARRHLSKLHMLDLAVLVGPPGLFFGRLANFVNAELWGHPLPGSMRQDPPWWSVKYPDQILLDPDLAQHPALETLRSVVRGGDRFYENIVQAVHDGNTPVIATVQPLLTAYYPSQIFQAIAEGPLLLVILALSWWGPRKPGVVGSVFLMSYGVMRIISEVYRQPDAGVAQLCTPLGDLSRGQVLSVLMVVSGVVGFVVCAFREVEPVGGLVRTAK